MANYLGDRGGEHGAATADWNPAKHPMRITGGQLKGHNIIAPKVSDLRPSQDIVRKAIFDILDHSLMPQGYRFVLDLYAGTGALGIEALSKGAQFVDFVEKDLDAIEAIKQNLNHTHLLGRADIYLEKAQHFVRSDRPEKYDLIFLDPPYADEPREVILALPRLLDPKGLVVYLHGQQVVLDKDSRAWLGQHLRVVDDRKYGATVVTFLKRT